MLDPQLLAPVAPQRRDMPGDQALVAQYEYVARLDDADVRLEGRVPDDDVTRRAELINRHEIESTVGGEEPDKKGTDFLMPGRDSLETYDTAQRTLAGLPCLKRKSDRRNCRRLLAGVAHAGLSPRQVESPHDRSRLAVRHDRALPHALPEASVNLRNLVMETGCGELENLDGLTALDAENRVRCMNASR